MNNSRPCEVAMTMTLHFSVLQILQLANQAHFVIVPRVHDLGYLAHLEESGGAPGRGDHAEGVQSEVY
jgi:hypothetical protein